MQRQMGRKPAARIAAALTAAVLLALLLLSSAVLAVQTGHDCPGENCVICAGMEAVVTGLSRAGGAVFCLALLLSVFRLGAACIPVPAARFRAFTLTGSKIRLNR